ncbi:MAG: KUP/HAK/KT family potassium transporter, partial [Proteobacteria bacterium]|nr:KUP/HAK/KT family potassium transporter [Pseudomonadota bacterium]
MLNPETALGEGSDGDAALGEENGHAHKQGLAALTLGAIGVVYGDIGTSPLYAMREALRPVAADGLERIEVLGVVSLLVWTLMLIVTVKYVMILLRADNHGEGGMLALYALTRLAIGRRSYVVLGLGIAGAALFFGDSVITPAVSILSAVEGIELVAPSFDRFIIPVTIGIILALFLIQRHGTHSISKFFGPVMTVWFLVMGISGAGQLSHDLGMLAAFNPYYGFAFLAQHGLGAFFVMGAIFLAVTGAEALYADLGHFGRPPIRNAWFALIFPALILNYLGQGALVQRNPDSLVNPFFFMVPASTLPAFVALATVATIIASQSVISGAFSLARAAVQLGLLPRLSIIHTSGSQSGQIYIPAVNWMLMCGVLAFVLNFRSSEALASAYGISVTGAMVVDTIMGIIYAHRGWRLSYVAILPLAVPLLGLETTFFVSNMTKFF